VCSSDLFGCGTVDTCTSYGASRKGLQPSSTAGQSMGDEGDIDFRTVDVHIDQLRKALKQEGKPNLIRTVRTAGYSLDIEN